MILEKCKSKSYTVMHTPTCQYLQKLFETIFNMRYYSQKYRFPSKTAKWNQKKKKKKNTIYKFIKRLFLFFWKLTKMFKLILCISEIPKTFIFVRVRQVTFLSEDWKNVSIWSSVLFTVSALEVCEREAYRKQTGSNVPVLLNKVATLEHDRFCRFHFRLSNDYLQVLKPES